MQLFSSSMTHSHAALARPWLILAIMALALAGLFSLPPVILRGPFFADLIPVDVIFSTSLVLHVDLSVVVWMCALSCMVMSFLAPPSCRHIHRILAYAAAMGMVLMVVSPLVAAPLPLKNNYVPVLQNPLFFLGLGLFGASVSIVSAMTLFMRGNDIPSAWQWAIRVLALSFVAMMVGFIVTNYIIDVSYYPDIEVFYEDIFWVGGHIMQMGFVALLMIVWLHLVYVKWPSLAVSSVMVKSLFSLHALLTLIGLFPFLMTDDYMQIRDMMTQHMIYTGGVTPVLWAVMVCIGYFKRDRDFVPLHGSLALSEGATWALIWSLILFAMGGIFGFSISGVNVTIPAHYHGSIVAMTLGLIAFVYDMLPRFGYRAVSGRLALWQPLCYGVGQGMHISGLFIMGGYGALRKDPGSSVHVDTLIGKGLFFSGGAVAIVGGLLFIVVIVKAMRSRS